MINVTQIGNPPWTRDEILESIEEFSEIYSKRPIRDNSGGMKAPHMFAVWFMARSLSPDVIVESGIWKGQSTWLLEQACPKSTLIAIDLNLERREYISERVKYSDRDFCEQDWSIITDRSLVFFDDHQNAYRRLRQCKWFGFKHIIFEDNYPVSQGDCYSLKKAYAGAGFQPLHSQYEIDSGWSWSGLLRRAASAIGLTLIRLTPQYETVRVEPNNFDAHLLYKHLEVYFEFPPVFKIAETRWGDKWEEPAYPTPPPLMDQPQKLSHEIFLHEAAFYTWICYAKLK